MHNKRKSKKFNAEYVLIENDVAQNAKKELNTLSYEEEKTKCYIRKRNRHSEVNGWYQPDLLSKTPFKKGQNYILQVQPIIDSENKSQCMPFRDYEKIINQVRRVGCNKNLERKSKKEKQLRFSLINIKPIFNNQGSNQKRQRNNFKKQSFVKKSLTPNIHIKKGSIQPAKGQRDANQEKSVIKEIKFSSGQVEINKLKRHLPKHRIIKSNFPVYFNYKSSTNYQLEFMKRNISPEILNYNSCLDAKQVIKNQLKHEFIAYMRNKKQKSNHQKKWEWKQENRNTKCQRFQSQWKEDKEKNKITLTKSLKSII